MEIVWDVTASNILGLGIISCTWHNWVFKTKLTILYNIDTKGFQKISPEGIELTMTGLMVLCSAYWANLVYAS